MKYFCIGDLHIKGNNHDRIYFLMKQMEKYLNEEKPDRVIMLGDTLDKHEKINTPELNIAIECVKTISSLSKLYILVGNHDMVCNKEYLTQNHWLNCLKIKECQNIVVVDQPIYIEENNQKIGFCPYVPENRFIEALHQMKIDFKECSYIFAHQDINGCKYNNRESGCVEKWDETYPFLISGHIHNKQGKFYNEETKLPKNVLYTGSCIQVASDEPQDKSCLLLDTTTKAMKEIYFEQLYVKIYPVENNNDVKKLLTEIKPEDKVILNISNDNLEEIIRIKKLVENNSNIKLKYHHKEVVSSSIRSGSTFVSLMAEKLKTNNLVKTFRECSNFFQTDNNLYKTILNELNSSNIIQEKKDVVKEVVEKMKELKIDACCEYVFKKGKNTGERCGKNKKLHSSYCSAHTKS